MSPPRTASLLLPNLRCSWPPEERPLLPSTAQVDCSSYLFRKKVRTFLSNGSASCRRLLILLPSTIGRPQRRAISPPSDYMEAHNVSASFPVSALRSARESVEILITSLPLYPVPCINSLPCLDPSLAIRSEHSGGSPPFTPASPSLIAPQPTTRR